MGNMPGIGNFAASFFARKNQHSWPCSWSCAVKTLIWIGRIILVTIFLCLLMSEVKDFYAQNVVTHIQLQTATFPLVTLCQAKAQTVSQWLPVMERVAEGGITMEEAFSLTTMPYPHDGTGNTSSNTVVYGWQLEHYSPPQNSTLGHWLYNYGYFPARKNTDTVHFFANRCGTFYPNNSIFSLENPQGNGKLVISLAVDPAFVTEHNSAYIAWVHYKAVFDYYLYPLPLLLWTLVLRDGLQTSMKVAVTGDQRLNRRFHRCCDRADYDRFLCRQRCNERRLMDVLGCRLPSMAGNSYGKHLPMCRSVPQSDRLRGLAIEGGVLDGPALHFIEEWVLYNASACGCPIPCRSRTISLTTAPEDGMPVPAGTTSLKLSFDFISRENIEMLQLPAGRMFSNVGGLLGLLLGFSAFSALDLVGWLVRRLLERASRRRRREVGASTALRGKGAAPTPVTRIV